MPLQPDWQADFPEKPHGNCCAVFFAAFLHLKNIENIGL